MKIIDNKKDYYDYLSGIYGVDDKVVYDRRGSIPSATIVNGIDSPFFSKKIFDTEHGYTHDTYDNPLSFYDKDHDKYYSKSDFRIVVEAGTNHYYIKVERFRVKKEDPITIKFTGMSEDDYWKSIKNSNDYHYRWMLERLSKEETEGRKKVSNAPLAIIFYNKFSHSYQNGIAPSVYENPILKDIPGICGCVDPDWIWQSLYEYLSSLNDKDIIDNRTDIQHLESAGFDRKTSFRNIK